VYDTEKTLYIVLELVTGGELFDAINDVGHFSEEVAKGKKERKKQRNKKEINREIKERKK